MKRGILQACGFPIGLPAISLSENFVEPTTMIYRNLLAMEAEELLRSRRVDGVVLMGGCDKATPGLLLGAISMNLPAIHLPPGPMLRGNGQGRVLGRARTPGNTWTSSGRVSSRTRIGSGSRWHRALLRHLHDHGHASTMTAIAEALGMSLSGASSISAPNSGHIRMATACGRPVVEMVWEDLTPCRVQTLPAFENAITVATAMGCSTNAIIHPMAMARRAGAKLLTGLRLDVQPH